jgi:hypothetical protein
MRADVGRFEPARAVRAKSEAAVIGGIAENENRRPAANFAARQIVANQETADAAPLPLGPRGDRPERQRGKWRDTLKIRRSRRFSRHRPPPTRRPHTRPTQFVDQFGLGGRRKRGLQDRANRRCVGWISRRTSMRRYLRLLIAKQSKLFVRFCSVISSTVSVPFSGFESSRRIFRCVDRLWHIACRSTLADKVCFGPNSAFLRCPTRKILRCAVSQIHIIEKSRWRAIQQLGYFIQ